MEISGGVSPGKRKRERAMAGVLEREEPVPREAKRARAAISEEDESTATTSESESTSSSQSSDEGSMDSSDDGDEQPITTLPRPHKPSIGSSVPASNPLLSRLSTFLPTLAAANESLEADRMAGELDKHAIEAVEDGETYIEMDLGLGVVEERRDDQGSSISDDDGESKGKEAQLETETGESDVLGRLMGHRTCRNLTSADKAGAKPKIEEVGEK